MKKKDSALFWFILCISIICVFGSYILGDSYYMYNDVGADTVNLYFPYYINVANDIKNGTLSFWNWDWGLGESFYHASLYFFDPFAWIVILTGVFGGIGCIKYTLVWMQIIKIIVIYYIGKKLATYLLVDSMAINIFAFFVTINGYIFLWGQHFFLGTAYFYMLLLLYCIEAFLDNRCPKNKLLLTVTVACCKQSSKIHIFSPQSAHFYINPQPVIDL